MAFSSSYFSLLCVRDYLLVVTIDFFIMKEYDTWTHWKRKRHSKWVSKFKPVHSLPVGVSGECKFFSLPLIFIYCLLFLTLRAMSVMSLGEKKISSFTFLFLFLCFVVRKKKIIWKLKKKNFSFIFAFDWLCGLINLSIMIHIFETIYQVIKSRKVTC